ncbi:hypothetical protein YSY43_15270 [Paenibacillus sp. YSY-4.3]
MESLIEVTSMKLWMDKMQVVRRAIEGFWKNIKLYSEEDPEEFEENFPNYDPAFLEVEVQSVSITFDNFPELNYNHVHVVIPIRYKGKNIGMYKILFTFDGHIEDDFFIID